MSRQVIIHLSDLHVGQGQKETVRVQRLFEGVSKRHPGVPVLITGDITDNASEVEFAEAKHLFTDLARTNPILAVPGNHDYAWKGNLMFDPDSWSKWLEYLGSPLGWEEQSGKWLERDSEPAGVDGLGIWRHNDCAFIGIDSGDPDDKVISARGYVSDTLCRGLKGLLKANAGKTRIVMLHHHPFTEGFFWALKGADRFLSTVKNNCEILLFGHDHNYGIWYERGGIPLMVASHKCTSRVSGDCLMCTVIEIHDPGTEKSLISHRLEVV
ncbi:MAG: metallophosphoesterase [Desulfomonilaceae bacterium]|nr:metallophosphoesterase [Desulfomonilaceae bacterium]